MKSSAIDGAFLIVILNSKFNFHLEYLEHLDIN